MREGIQAFQRDFGLKRDAILHPGGETQTRLDALITPLIQEAANAPANGAPTLVPASAQSPSPHPPRTAPDAPPPEEEPPTGEDPDEANCATLWKQLETTRAELEQIEADIALLETDPKESDRNMTWRYAQLLEEYGGYSTAPPDTPLSILKIPDVSKPGTGVDGPASTSGIKRGKGLTGLAGSVDKIVRTNPEQVNAARERAIQAMERLK